MLQMRKLRATGMGSLAQDCVAVSSSQERTQSATGLVRMFYETPELPSDEVPMLK